MYEKRVKSGIIILLSCVMIIVFGWLGLTFFNSKNIETKNIDLNAAIIYDGNGQSWKDTYEHLEQSLIANLSISSINIGNSEYDLSSYDVIYVDKSILEAENKVKIKDEIVAFTKAGGGLFLENDFYNFFNKDFIGAGEFVKLDGAPKQLKFPEVQYNLEETQSVIKDFDFIYKDYIDYNLLDTYDYGYGIKNAKGTVLAEENGVALYTMNKVGNGYVFFTNPLLPNHFNINGSSMTPKNNSQKYFANTTASSNQLIENQFAAFLSKEKHGFSVERVLGNYGRPSVAWQLHYEEITGIENNSAEIFAQIAEENLQIPSFSLVRNFYNWYQRHEVVSYLINEREDKKLIYNMDEYENAYSSGRHVVSEGKWLSLGVVKEGGSYFVDYPEYDLRAYPFEVDLNKDGTIDLLTGSKDGYFHFFEGEKMGDNFETSKDVKLTNSKQETINVDGYSAPIMVDIDGDKILDIVSGSSDGNLYWFLGNGDLTFEDKGVLFQVWDQGQSLPTIGDVNNDGVSDLVVGGNNKKIKLYDGKKNDSKLEFTASLETDIIELEEIEGNWISPHIRDINSDGLKDIIIGTFDGYIAKFLRDGEKFSFDGYMQGNETNYKGNKNLKFGNNATPTFSDLNNDGKLDLVVGSLEYGLAYPMDSIYFPMKDKLSEQIKFMKDKGYYMGFHFYTNINASDEYEKNELNMQSDTMKSYDIDLEESRGFNQHTWHTSKVSPTQSLENGFEAGLLWNSGFKPSCSDAIPQISAETALTIPFYLQDENDKKTMIFNTSTLLYDNKGWANISAKYDLPISMYYHTDFAYEDRDKIELDVKELGEFTRKYDYNFVTEDQYAKAIAASYNTEFSVAVKNNGEKKEDILIKSKTKDKKIPLYDKDYQDAKGVKVILGEKYVDKQINTDSPIWFQDENKVYMGIDKETVFNIDDPKQFHLNRANLPVNVNYTKDGAKVKFKDDGMMQIEVTGNVTTSDKGWNITKSENRKATILTKFGKAETLNIQKTD